MDKLTLKLNDKLAAALKVKTSRIEPFLEEIK